MKLRAWLLVLLCLLALPVQAAATQDTPTYDFLLTADGQQTLEVNTGDIITLMLRLRRTDSQQSSMIYGIQAELRYDSAMLELVPDSAAAYQGVDTTDIALTDGYREYYMTFLSLAGGAVWQADTLVGTVQFRVIGQSGVTRITNEDFLVSLPDGSGSYACTANEVLLILSTDCTVSFQTNGGTPLEPVTAIFGEKLPRPQDPVREGYRLVGWYRDIHLTEEWDFDADTVQGNMTLYAKWEAGDPVPSEPEQPAPPVQEDFPWWWLLIPLALALLWWLSRKNKNVPPAGAGK